MIDDGTQRYKCDTCSCTFRKLGSLYAHMSKVHAEEDVVEEEGDGVKGLSWNADGPGRSKKIENVRFITIIICYIRG